MSNTLLGLNTYASSFSLNSDLIDKLKTSETSAINKNLSADLEKLNSTSTIGTYFLSKINNILSLSKEKISNFSATTNGDNITYNSSDETKIKEGLYTFNVSSIAKRDVYQSNTFTNNYDLYGDEILTIKGVSIDTTGKTFDEVNTEINSIDGVFANIENVSSSEKRIVIKSTVSGTDNALNINSTFFNQTQIASNLNVDIDGVSYNLNENTFTHNGVSVSVNNTGTSSINIKKDSASAKEQFDAIISAYNDLNSYTNDTILYNTDFSGDKSAFKDTMSLIKKELFNNNLFAKGATLDKDGTITIEQELDINTMNNFTTNIKNILTDATSSSGILTKYKETQELLKTNINNEISNNLSYLDKKYEELSSHYTAYNSLISSFEMNFSSLKQFINNQNSN